MTYFVFNGELCWEKLLPFPSRAEIEARRDPQGPRSPYLSGWLNLPPAVRFTEYQIDFRAGHLPRGTYCCLGCWTLDLSGLEKIYPTIRANGSHAYAGLQRLADGRTVSILSFWDIFCTDRFGKERILRPKILYPDAPIYGSEFGGEGTGARCIAPYAWEANHWYRMHLRCLPSPEAGTTLVEQWIRDLETKEKRLLCRYDTGIPHAVFRGNAAVFLENFLPETAGEIRSMEVRKAIYRRADTGRWEAFPSVYLSAEYGYGHAPHGMLPCQGSYNFGVSGDRIWMITSGAGGDWYRNGKGSRGRSFTLAKD